MRIIVNHLTRMQPGFICVAGVDVTSGRHVRPVLRSRLTTDMLASKGGPFDMAELVDFSAVECCGRAPETEDYFFNPRSVRAVRLLTPTNFWQLLRHIARDSLAQIFGPSLTSFRRGCVVDLDSGEVSLGCLVPVYTPHLYVNGFGKVRARIRDGGNTFDLSVTDLRLYDMDHGSP
jgi:hypothetical protein